jgi:DNA-binding transcriptional LysR family regulator
MELRQLRAFVTVATELHFARAAERLYVSPTTLSDTVRRLEDELNTPLFIRTTRRVELTAAGVELLERARTILGDVEAAERAVRLIADAESGTVRLGVIPPAALVLAPHLVEWFAGVSPLIRVEVRRMWLPDLISELGAGNVDVGISCGRVTTPNEITSEDLCAERLLVGLRTDHRLANQEAVALTDLAEETLGISSDQLFPAWVLSQRQALQTADISPPTVELRDTDLTASHWIDQPQVDWILLISSLCSTHANTAIRPVTPAQQVPFTLHWKPTRTRAPAVRRFVEAALTADPPPGWTASPQLASPH